ncbi:uracil-DNA glycosylase [Bartonella tamiae]|uniref:Type-4 uracil-DNA glycosylase n=1 Tax=Bartonella tamiae Th239 TaxID=1094558 RepID=J0R4K3_9HYPH|nr:uracil-DNA glycosylase [Bartonella tamiae]EJF90594.1 uracil-DNA glycosylase, family 4 [Bartonella tamiae Th239]EJF94028.1 uracil-DNA glycosylase, family 4 [Bartonella tamiae Th307]
MTQSISTISYEELLGFFDCAGVDRAISEEPINRFAQSELLEQELKPAFQRETKKSNKHYTNKVDDTNTNFINTQTNSGAFKTTLELAQSAKSLEELHQYIQNFDRITLKLTAKNTCIFDGNPQSSIMIIGDTPGREEDKEGVPFVGRSGQLLNRILEAIGYSRKTCYITNIIPWRPPGNRRPTLLEIEQCRPFIEKQIAFIKPQILVALGDLATHVLTGTNQGIIRSRGKWLEHISENKHVIPVMPTFHPDYILKTPSQKKLVWKDFLTILKALKAESS